VPSYRTASVSTQTVQQVLQATGTIEPGAAATVTFPVSGTVASVRVAMGDPVRAGEVLATLDTTTLRSALASAQKDEGVRARFLGLGMEPVLDTPEEFAKIVKTQQEKDSALVKGLDLKTTQ